MTTPHKATPEQWEHIEQRILAIDPGCSCLLELRDRIAALEEAANSSAGLTSSPAPAGGLVEQVMEALTTDPFANTEADARAAILAVADWFASDGLHVTAAALREEVEKQ